MRFICHNGHDWDARSVNPVKCQECSSRRLYNIDNSVPNPGTFLIKIHDKHGVLAGEARAHTWDILEVLKRMEGDVKEGKITVEPKPDTVQIRGRMGMTVSKSFQLENVDLFGIKKSAKVTSQVGGSRVELGITFKHATSIEYFYKRRKSSWRVYEVVFTVQQRARAVTRQDKNRIKKNWVNPLKKRFEDGGASILFVDFFPDITT